ncbi:MAG: gamma carbonic anhydrase family protein [Deltaproteobacteria bacterium]|nr:MAG: gamma carbonic anhydrase family protein [Deltaproteobacteria bacterium]
MVRSYRGVWPTLGAGVFVAETAAVIGDVVVGDRSSIWYGAVVRGDVFHIRIGAETSIQDNSVIHVTSGRHATLVGDRVTVGHSVTLHGCTVEDRCIIGMGAVVLDRARVGAGSIVGAGALVTPGTEIPPGHLAVGAPARVKRPLTDAERAWIETSADHYVALAAEYLAGE